MKTSIISCFLVSILIAVGAQADPIEDLSMKPYQAGWYPNFINGNGPMTCPETCKKWVEARAERERSNVLEPQSEVTHVCKITRDPHIILESINDPSSHWLYGNQFDKHPVCYTGMLSGEVKRSEYFMCLCVKPGCDGPDLIISKIHRPVWDHAAQESIIKVDVTNIGTVAAGVSKTQLSDVVTGHLQILATPALPAGNTVTLTFRFPYWVFDPNADLEAEADLGDNVKECDEGNNILQYFVLG